MVGELRQESQEIIQKRDALNPFTRTSQIVRRPIAQMILICLVEADIACMQTQPSSPRHLQVVKRVVSTWPVRKDSSFRLAYNSLPLHQQESSRATSSRSVHILALKEVCSELIAGLIRKGNDILLAAILA